VDTQKLFKVTIPHEARTLQFELVGKKHMAQTWSSRGSMSLMQCSVWEFQASNTYWATSKFQIASEKVCLGSTISKNFAKTKLYYLKMSDSSSFGLTGSPGLQPEILGQFLPHPTSFVLLWKQLKGHPIYVWRPVPLDHRFVALGMVITTTPSMPDITTVRCIPKHWLVQVPRDSVTKVWEDQAKSVSFWVGGNLNLLQFSEGVGAPSAPIFTFWKEKFKGYQSNNDV